jgi:hypothetical protein
MDTLMSNMIKEELIWIPEKGAGHFPVHNAKYDVEYFNKYVRYERTPIGHKINAFRKRIVNKYTRAKVLDIGIGSGSFIKYRGNCLGYDINPKGRAWLEKKGLFFDPYRLADFNPIRGVTFFDSLEHIRRPEVIFYSLTDQFVFVSIPIFKDLEHLLKSKHLRKDEHYYYFTEKGFIEYMSNYSFNLLEIRDDEIKCGREDVYTFIFKKKAGQK